MDRRQFHLHLLLAGLVPGMARAGTAPSPDGYPDRPIRIVVPYPAGGVVDVVLRLGVGDDVDVLHRSRPPGGRAS